MTVGLRPEAARNSSVASTRRSIWPVRMSLAPAGVDLDARVGEHARASASLLISRIWPIDGLLGVRRRRTGSCPRRGRSRSTRAASSRRGSASGRSRGAPRPAGRISKSRCGAVPRVGLADAAEDRAGDDAGALAQRLERDVLAVEAERRAEVAGSSDAVDRAGALELLRRRRRAARSGRVGWANRRSLAARGAGCAAASRACGVARGAAAGAARAACVRRRLRGRGGGRGRRGVLAPAARAPCAICCLRRRARLRRRVGLGDRAEVPVRVRVAVDVLQLDEAAEALARRRCATIRPSLTAIDRRAACGRRSRSPRRVGADSTTTRGVAAPCASCVLLSALDARRRRSPWRATGKRPCVRPVSEPTRSAGRPPITRARMRTESTYQSAWL